MDQSQKKLLIKIAKGDKKILAALVNLQLRMEKQHEANCQLYQAKKVTPREFARLTNQMSHDNLIAMSKIKGLGKEYIEKLFGVKLDGPPMQMVDSDEMENVAEGQEARSLKT